MNGDADYQAVLADLKKRRDEIDAAITAVESIVASLGINPATFSGKIRSTQDIPTDAFLTLTIPEAAIKFLGMVRSAQSVAQIWEALKQGGLTHTKYNAVYNALFRRENQVGDVVKLPDGNWGLSEWYATSPSARRRTKKVSEVTPSESDTPAKAAVEKPPTEKRTPRQGTMLDSIEAILREADKPLHAEKIVEKLGRSNVRSVAGSLPQDARKRFRLVGKNIWALAEWPPLKG